MGCSLTTPSSACTFGEAGPPALAYRLSATCRDAVQGRRRRRAQRAGPGLRRRRVASRAPQISNYLSPESEKSPN